MTSIKRRFVAVLSLGFALGPVHPVSAEPPEARLVEPPAVIASLSSSADLLPEIISQATAQLDLERAQRDVDAALAAIHTFLSSIKPPPPATPRAAQSRWPGCDAPNTSDLVEMQRIVTDAAHEFGVDPGQLIRIPPRESGWNAMVQNCSSGACGLFQHLPQYWAGRAEAIGSPGADCRDPVANARAAAMMFRGSRFTPWAPSGPY